MRGVTGARAVGSGSCTFALLCTQPPQLLGLARFLVGCILRQCERHCRPTEAYISAIDADTSARVRPPGLVDAVLLFRPEHILRHRQYLAGMQDICSRLRRREAAILALTVSALVVVTWASMTPTPPRVLAGAKHITVSEVTMVLQRMALLAGLLGLTGQHGRADTFSYVDLEQDRTLNDSIHAPAASASDLHHDSAGVVSGPMHARVQSAAAADASSPAQAVSRAQPQAFARADTPAPGQRAFVDALAGSSAASVGEFQPSDVGAVPPPGAPPGPANSIAAAAVRGSLPSPADARWTMGAARDLRACLYDEDDGRPATAEGLLAGELPRQGPALHPAGQLL